MKVLAKVASIIMPNTRSVMCKSSVVPLQEDKRIISVSWIMDFTVPNRSFLTWAVPQTATVKTTRTPTPTGPR